jgi:hypothetical protein
MKMKKIIVFWLMLAMSVSMLGVTGEAFLGMGYEMAASEVKVIKTGLLGQKITFNDADFKQAYAITDFQSVTVNTVPKSSEGTTNITNCLFTGAISKKVQKTGNKVMYIGGIAGGCYDINRPAVLTNCLSAGTIYDVEDCAGALVGQLKCFDSSITGCYATTSTDCASPFYFKEAAVVNGVRWNTTEYENACSALMVNRNDILGDLAKTNMPLLINDTNTAWECVESRTPILSYFADWWFARQQ